MTDRDLAELQQQHVDAMRAAAPRDGEAQKALDLLRDRVERYDRFCGRGRPALVTDLVVAAKAVLALPPAPSDGREAREDAREDLLPPGIVGMPGCRAEAYEIDRWVPPVPDTPTEGGDER